MCRFYNSGYSETIYDLLGRRRDLARALYADDSERLEKRSEWQPERCNPSLSEVPPNSIGLARIGEPWALAVSDRRDSGYLKSVLESAQTWLGGGVESSLQGPLRQGLEWKGLWRQAQGPDATPRCLV
jgi:hypothetical protein